MPAQSPLRLKKRAQSIQRAAPRQALNMEKNRQSEYSQTTIKKLKKGKKKAAMLTAWQLL
jgi:hypothetical protein